MTPEELACLSEDERQIAVARALGWTEVRRDPAVRMMRGTDPSGVTNRKPPEFGHDLHAWNEIEGVFTPHQADHYEKGLARVLGGNRGLWHAKAWQRRDAFLLCLDHLSGVGRDLHDREERRRLQADARAREFCREAGVA